MKIEQVIKRVGKAIKQYIFSIFIVIAIINIPEYYISLIIPKVLSGIAPIYVSLLLLAVAGIFEMWLIFIFCELLEAMRLGKRWSMPKTIIKTFMRLPGAIPMMLVIIIFTILGTAFYVFPGVVWFIFTAFSYQIYYFSAIKDLEAIKLSFKFVIKTGAEAVTLVSMMGVLVYLSSYSLRTFLVGDQWYIGLLVVCLNGIVAGFSYLMMTQFFIVVNEEAKEQR